VSDDPLERVENPLLRLELGRLREQGLEHARRRAFMRPGGCWVSRETLHWQPPLHERWRGALVSLLLDALGEETGGSRDPETLLAALDEDGLGYWISELLLDFYLAGERDPPLTDGEIRLLAGISAVSIVDQARSQLEEQLHEAER
jgi:hypothetical protein